MNITKTIDKYLKIRGKKLPKIQDFWNKGDVKFLVMQCSPLKACSGCNTIEKSFTENIETFAKDLDIISDHIPYLEPWFGTGVYANAYGCKYVWREGEAPAVHYRYKKIEEVRGIKKPSIDDSEVMRMVIDAIRYYKEKTSGKLPISLTDTQSAFDTATLILDAVEFFTACYTEPETVKNFMKTINDLIIEFSKVQFELIGDAAAKPGHIMVSDTAFSGISVSDDNLAVSSPKINEEFSFPMNQELSSEFGGIAIHSCGVWAHTMKLLSKINNVKMVDFALSKFCDPNPNIAEDVKNALKGTSIIVKARVGTDLTETDTILDSLFDHSLRLVVHLGYVENEKEREKNYYHVVEKLNKLYSENTGTLSR